MKSQSDQRINGREKYWEKRKTITPIFQWGSSHKTWYKQVPKLSGKGFDDCKGKPCKKKIRRQKDAGWKEKNYPQDREIEGLTEARKWDCIMICGGKGRGGKKPGRGKVE